MANLTNWNSLMDKYDLVLFVEFQTMKKIDLEQLRENYKAMRRVALSNLNKQLEFLGKQGQLLNIDVSDSELIDSLEEKYQIKFFKYSRILDFKDGYKPKGLIMVTLNPSVDKSISIPPPRVLISFLRVIFSKLIFLDFAIVFLFD